MYLKICEERETRVAWLRFTSILRGRRALIVCVAQFKQVPHSWCQRSFCKSQLRFHLSTFTHGNFCSSYNKLCQGMLLKNCTLHGTLYNSFALSVCERGKEGSGGGWEYFRYERSGNKVFFSVSRQSFRQSLIKAPGRKSSGSYLPAEESNAKIKYLHV